MNAHRRHSVVVAMALVVLSPLPTQVRGEPYVPKSAAAVLERVPAARAARQLEPLRRRLQTRQDDLRAALELARGYLDLGRTTSDPRFVSYAQATLAPWLQRDDPPAAVLVLAATALQSSHQFEAALRLLDRALASEPRNAQAWLTRATLLQVQGRFPAARAACERLVQTAGQLVALTCITSVGSLGGRLEAAYRTLQRFAAPNLPDRDPPDRDLPDRDVRGWIFGQLGEMAVRLGEPAAAEQHFKIALRAAPADVWLKGAYADLLLWQRRDRQVIELLAGCESQDVLLLRLAIAGQRLRMAEAADWAHLYDARRRAARQDADPHLREHARFMLDVRGEPEAALRLAQKNWQVQREPADIRIYLRAAQRARQPRAAKPVRAWMRETGYEDRTLSPALRAALHLPQ